jgi:hypothetical protein
LKKFPLWHSIDLLAKIIPLFRESQIDFGAGAATQNWLKILDSGSRFALNTMRCRASLARNDDLIFLSRVLQQAPLKTGIQKSNNQSWAPSFPGMTSIYFATVSIMEIIL